MDPILEETPGALVVFTNSLTLQEQRAKKNEILKQKVKKLTAKESEPFKALP